VLFVVGNKIDLEEDRKVPAEEGRKYAESLKASFGETSAATDIGEETYLHTAYIYVTGSAKTGHNRIFVEFLFIKYL